MSKEVLRELYNQTNSKCRHCSRLLKLKRNPPRRKAKAPLFHPRPFADQPHCDQKLNKKKWKRYTEVFTNLEEEIDELQLLMTRYENSRRSAHFSQASVRRLFNKLQLQTEKIQDYLRSREWEHSTQQVLTTETIAFYH